MRKNNSVCCWRIWLSQLSHLRVDMVSADVEGVKVGLLWCYAKPMQARAILASSKRPTQVQPEGGDLVRLLPPTDKICWGWCINKCQMLGVGVWNY